MAEERKETWQEQPTVAVPSNEPTAPPPRGGSLVGFILGLIIGALVTLVITWFAWKIPLENAQRDVQDKERQLKMSEERAQKLRNALRDAQEAINRALGSLGTQTPTGAASPTPAPTPSPQSR
ncbi:MAG: hypothetical protein SLRJCFUN_002622 [Candidatus Fervidibacter sp.]